MIITVSGTGGSGKSSVAKILASKLGYAHASIGDLQREIAREKSISILELGELEAKDRKIDALIDEKQSRLGERENIVIDTWLGAHFIPHAFKVFIDADLAVRVDRRVKQKREEESFEDKNEAMKSLKAREEINRERWIRYYGFDYLDKSNYDLIIDTTHRTAEEVAKAILDKIDEAAPKRNWPKRNR
ncbi:(d)CMP kinase [Candidatus Woesearchaeota archaeon]|nr:(d)CMP kinase [Candidatus Woesearchaeota archaeon]